MVEGTGLQGMFLDVDHAVETQRQNHQQCGAQGIHHDGATAPFDPVEKKDDCFSQRILEKKCKNEKHFSEDQTIE